MASTTTAEIRIDGQRVAEVEEFDYSSDILAVGEEAHITIPNPDGRYTEKLLCGQMVEFLMRDPAVNGGAPTLKHLGRITQRQARWDRGGSKIKIVSADLGWHLLKCCAPLWFNLKQVEFSRLIDPKYSTPGRKKPVPSLVNEEATRFGFRGVRAGNILNRRTKLGLAVQQLAGQLQPGPVFAIQAEPGELIYDIISSQLRRYNKLLNVSVDGFIQVFEPDYKQSPLYSFTSQAGNLANNILDVEESESLESIYTEVSCVGQQVAWEGYQNTRDPNAGKKRGTARKPSALPFTHRLTYADPELFTNDLAQRGAEWRMRRSLFDSYLLTINVKEHHQNGIWYEADTIARVAIDKLGIRENLYTQSVQCRVNTREGAVTQIMLRKPGLLTAAFGEIPDPPIRRAKS